MSVPPPPSSSGSTLAGRVTSRLLPLVRSYLIAQGQKLVLQYVARRVSDAAEKHVPLVGASTIPHLLSLLAWRDQLAFAETSSAAQAAVAAHFGHEHSPLDCRPDQLAHVLRSRVCRLARHVRIDCREIATLTPESIDVLRAMPLLRGITFRECATEDSELLVLLTRRPPLELLQCMRIERCHSLDAQAIYCFRCMPNLHTLALVECTLNGEHMLDDLPEFKHLETLSLDFTPGDGFHSSSLRPLASVQRLKRLHLNTLCCPTVGFLRPVFHDLFESPVFTQKLESLSLCYVSLVSPAGGDLADDEYARLAQLHALRQLEISWCAPLPRILPHVCRLPLLTTLLLGDDHVQLVDRLLESTLIPAPCLRTILLYGFVGVSQDRFDEWTALVDVSATPMHPQALRYLGPTRTEALQHECARDFEWAR